MPMIFPMFPELRSLPNTQRYGTPEVGQLLTTWMSGAPYARVVRVTNKFVYYLIYPQGRQDEYGKFFGPIPDSPVSR